MCKTSTYLMTNPWFFNLNLRALLRYTFIGVIIFIAIGSI